MEISNETVMRRLAQIEKRLDSIQTRMSIIEINIQNLTEEFMYHRHVMGKLSEFKKDITNVTASVYHPRKGEKRLGETIT